MGIVIGTPNKSSSKSKTGSSFLGGQSKNQKAEEQRKREHEEAQSKLMFSIIERQKDLETSFDTLNEKLNLLEKTSIDNNKKIFEEIRDIKSKLTTLSENTQTLNSQNRKIAKQFNLVSRKDDVQMLEKYIDLWKPLDFVTRQEMKKIRKETIQQLKNIIEDFLKEDVSKKRDD